jgi:thiol-disulfide isomerase/thioredoxin
MEFLKNTDLFKKVKSELTDGWALGGLLSLLGSAFMMFLVVSEVGAYLSSSVATNVQMSGDMDTQLLIQFNVSLPRLPCAFASVDVRDVIGTSKMNVTKDIRKWKLHEVPATSAKGGEGGGGARLLGEAVQRGHEMNDDLAAPKHEAEGAHPEDPVEKAQALNANNFDSFVAANEIVLVNFYAPWCHWSRRLMPTWHHTAQLVSRKPYGYNTKIAMVDCTHRDAVALCRRAHINAFPMVTVFRNNINTREFYHGDRTAEAFIKFIEHVREQNHGEVHKALGHTEGAKGRRAKDSTIQAKKGAEGCLISGQVYVNKVPGSLSIAAHSKHHTIAASLINTTHAVHHFSFGDLPPRRKSGLLQGAYDAANRLGDTYWVTTGANHTHEHYVKVVSVVYEGTVAEKMDWNTYRYTVNSHEYKDDIDYAGAKFTYDLSPMTVSYSQQSMPFYHLITSLCAILGGIFTVLGLLDSALFRGYKSVVVKKSIGKLG